MKDGLQEEKNWDKECNECERILTGDVLYNYSAFRHDIFIKHHIFHEFVRRQKAIIGQTLRGAKREIRELVQAIN